LTGHPETTSIFQPPNVVKPLISAVYTNETMPARLESEAFERFVSEVEPRLRRALVAAYGTATGREATADALSWAWEHWNKLEGVSNPVAYLYRVGQSRMRSKKQPIVFERSNHNEPWVEPGLGPALVDLSEAQRTAVVLIYGFSWTLREVAELGGITISTVQTHLERGLRNLRAAMEVHDNA
jgi:DNA-directed RNA polymerase specialized sigma24 family protein